MAIVVRCECGRQLQAKDEYAGRRTKCPDCGRELTIPTPAVAALDLDLDAPDPVPEYAPRRPGRPPTPRRDRDFDDDPYEKGESRTSGMAISSLVLGIVSLLPCLNILTFIPAIVLGAVALSSIGKSRGQLKGKGLAIGGISTASVGALSIVALVLLSILGPAGMAANAAAKRAQCSNNLKQIGLGLHNFNSVNNRFPGRAIADQDGKPLLSWRVAILPYIDQQALYSKFHLDEPWDSPHNMALVAEMPTTYACPADLSQNKVTGMTGYRGFTGPGALFEDDQGSPLASVTDGTANTLAVVESSQPVTWTQPDELAFDPNSPTLPLLGSHHLNGFNALFADGSTRFLKSTVDPATLRALITRNGNEVVSSDAY